MKKKDLETKLEVSEKRRAELNAEVRDLRADLKKTHDLLLKAEARALGVAAAGDFQAALAIVSAKIDAEIEASASTPHKQWSLITIRKGLKGL